MSSASWPPQLKDWVAKCLSQLTDTNKAEAQAEMKQVISEAYSAGALWTTDWAAVQLQSLLPKAPPILNSLKRKTPDQPPMSKKAKKAAQKQAASNAATGWDPNDQMALHRRAERFQREHELEKSKNKHGNQNKSDYQSPGSYYSRPASRMTMAYANLNDEPEADPNVIDWDRYTIVGTCQDILKDYLRLTSEPKAETIRPYPVLQRTLLELKNRWKSKTPYPWICNQFKSLRQDLTVQRIKNEFTVQVYEIHARMALESNDMVEYNQCQATLKTLYELGIPGKVEEFTAYRILMLLHGRNRSELTLYVGQLTENQKADEAVRHALAVHRALSMGNYHSLFELYLSAPNMGAYIMDHFIDRERVKALMVITKAYRTIPVSFLHNELAFDDLGATHKWLRDHSAACFVEPSTPNSQPTLDCKQALPQLKQALEERYRKVMIKGAI